MTIMVVKIMTEEKLDIYRKRSDKVKRVSTSFKPMRITTPENGEVQIVEVWEHYPATEYNENRTYTHIRVYKYGRCITFLEGKTIPPKSKKKEWKILKELIDSEIRSYWLDEWGKEHTESYCVRKRGVRYFPKTAFWVDVNSAVDDTIRMMPFRDRDIQQNAFDLYDIYSNFVGCLWGVKHPITGRSLVDSYEDTISKFLNEGKIEVVKYEADDDYL